VDNLELEQNSSLSFLNIGVGTGYLSCIVAHILGPKSQSFGIEIHSDVIQHCQGAIDAWRESMEEDTVKPAIFHGNGLDILHQGESCIGYDRIYVGAEIEASDLQKLKNLLAPGGILVAPVDDNLTKVVRMNSLSEFRTQTISGVHFAPLLKNPRKSVLIPAKKWSPSRHHLYPCTFQRSTKALLLCSSSPYVQPPLLEIPNERINISAILPKDVWVHILSFTNRKCKSC